MTAMHSGYLILQPFLEKKTVFLTDSATALSEMFENVTKTQPSFQNGQTQADHDHE